LASRNERSSSNSCARVTSADATRSDIGWSGAALPGVAYGSTGACPPGAAVGAAGVCAGAGAVGVGVLGGDGCL
jgi:hypothetical protein